MASANLPNGSHLALGNRDPMSASLRNDLAKAAAISEEFGIVFDCALDDAVAVYEQLLSSLEKDAAHRLVERTRQLYRSLKVDPAAADTPTQDVKPKDRLH